MTVQNINKVNSLIAHHLRFKPIYVITILLDKASTFINLKIEYKEWLYKIITFCSNLNLLFFICLMNCEKLSKY